MHTAQDIQHALAAYATLQRAETCARFFKTGKGQYGEGDVFIGVCVPDCRTVARQARGANIAALRTLLYSPIHEHRLTALLVLVEQYKHATTQGEAAAQHRIVSFYTTHIARVNNWDLVDTSAWQILGEYAREHGDVSVLDEYAASNAVWKRRIAIVATFAYIRAGEYVHTLRVAEQLLTDSHDLIHKAVGWMLREIGKRDVAVLRQFLALHAAVMPRTMLRYAIERMP
jgi:3-methyladenine DNA glycosylase AlkD